MSSIARATAGASSSTDRNARRPSFATPDTVCGSDVKLILDGKVFGDPGRCFTVAHGRDVAEPRQHLQLTQHARVGSDVRERDAENARSGHSAHHSCAHPASQKRTVLARDRCCRSNRHGRQNLTMLPVLVQRSLTFVNSCSSAPSGFATVLPFGYPKAMLPFWK